MTDQMQRRHFEVIAGIIKRAELGAQERADLAVTFADALKQFNSNFDRARFVEACITGNMGKGRSHKNVK